MNPTFFEITLVISIAALLGILLRVFRQPPLLAYILTGILVGSLGLVRETRILDTMAQFGVTLLLFIIGLELNVKELKLVGKTAIITGTLQIIFTTIVGFLISLLLGFNLLTSLYLSLAYTFSSTIVIVKLLSDKKDLGSLYGKIAVGLLLIQDLVAIIALIVLSGLGSAATLEVSLLPTFLLILLKGIFLFLLTYYLSQRVFPKIVDLIAHSQELLFLVSIAWALGLAALVSSPPVGFSIEIGGLLAGMALANSSEHFQIAARVKPLRDFFIAIFFIILGSKITFPNVGSALSIVALLSFFVLIVKSFIVLGILGLQGFRKRTSFLTGLTVAQVSEFSLILVALGNKIGHVDEATVSLITLVAVITFALSSYMVFYNNAIYRLFLPLLGRFERRQAVNEKQVKLALPNHHIVVVGTHRMGKTILESLKTRVEKLVVVDFNPDNIGASSENIDYLFGDISDREIQEQAHLESAKLIISTVPDLEDNESLLEGMRKSKSKAKCIVIASTEADAKKLYASGADLVVLPHQIGGKYIASILEMGSPWIS